MLPILADDGTVNMWVTRESDCVLLWKFRPKWCIGGKFFFNGSECFRLPDDAFPELRMNECRPVAVALKRDAALTTKK